jgi:L-fuculokinase
MVMDCGSTNATVVAVDERGEMVCSASRPNGPAFQEGGVENWRVWDLGQVWSKLCAACREVCAGLNAEHIKAATICTFGADGAPVRRNGTQTYPAICWEDGRTEGLMADIGDSISPWEIYAETGYQVIRFNTLLRMMWLRKHAPEALDQADWWVMMPGLLSHRLCGEYCIDPTSGGTMMAMDMGCRDWSAKMLKLAGVTEAFFPPWVEPGATIGKVHDVASQQTGLPPGTPVIAAGHDTQYAAVGSGAAPGEAILSSGTWEILMQRVDRYEPSRFGFEEGVLYECDPERGLWNPQLLMMGSRVLEWIRQYFYADVAERDEAYGRMVESALNVQPGSGGVMVLPCFVPETGPTKKYNTHGTILGLTATTERGQVYRAALEGLSFQLRNALEVLTEATHTGPATIRVVGGGSRNDLWNQIRADVTGLPVTTIAQKEATVLGAALFAFIGTGVFSSVQEGQARLAGAEATFEPTGQQELYEEVFERYMQVPKALEGFYRG